MEIKPEPENPELRVNTVVQITYPYLLLFLWPYLNLYLNLGVLVSYLHIPYELGFTCIKSLVSEGCWRNDSKSFLLLAAGSCFVGLTHHFPMYHLVWLLLSLIAGRRIITLQIASISRRFLITTLLRSWLT